MKSKKTEKELLKLVKEHGWDWISYHKVSSESFIEKHKNKVNWFLISSNQILSEKFIEKHKDKLDWLSISFGQKLSEEFIEKHKDNIFWDVLMMNRNINFSDRFIIKYKLLGYIK